MWCSGAIIAVSLAVREGSASLRIRLYCFVVCTGGCNERFMLPKPLIFFFLSLKISKLTNLTSGTTLYFICNDFINTGECLDQDEYRFIDTSTSFFSETALRIVSI